jgi:hypothetical protein
MLAQHAATPQSPRRIGVSIDTSRYGLYAVFLKHDAQTRCRRTVVPRVRRRILPTVPSAKCAAGEYRSRDSQRIHCESKFGENRRITRPYRRESQA